MQELYNKEFSERIGKIVQLYYQNIKGQGILYDKEMLSATKIQSKFKMYKCRFRYKKFRKSSILIQKFLKGTLARLLVKRNAKDLSNVKIQRYFSNQAILIQKVFRGFYKRKYYHEFKARKNYLQFLKQKNEQFHNELLDYEQKEIQQKYEIEQQVAREEFIRIASNLHHLSSTKICPGVYNKPYQSQEIVFDLKVETHLQSVFQKNYGSIRRSQAIKYKQMEEQETTSGSKTSLIRFGGGSMTQLRKSNHFSSTGKLKLNPI